jgi:fluoride exporter
MPPRAFATTLLVAVGGVLGALGRFGLDTLVKCQVPGFPLATWIANVTGCIAIGALLVVLVDGPVPRWWLRPLLAVGILGGFTTYSSFAAESVQLTDAHAVTMAAWYIVATIVVGLSAVWMSATMTRWLLMRHRPSGPM